MSAPCPDFGFVVRLETNATEDGERIAAELVRLVESRGLACAGGGDRRLQYVVAGDAGQATSADRDAVAAWLDARVGAAIVSYEVGPLIDLESAV